MSGFHRKTRRVGAVERHAVRPSNGTSLAAQSGMDAELLAGSVHSIRTPYMGLHRARAGLLLVILGCGSGTLVSPDAGSTGAAGTLGAAGTFASAGTTGAAGVTGSAGTAAAGTIGSDEHGCGGFLGETAGVGATPELPAHRGRPVAQEV